VLCSLARSTTASRTHTYRPRGLFCEKAAILDEVAGIEKRVKPVDFNNGDVLPLERIGEAMRPNLREEFWCRLEGRRSFLHFGWDFYVYIDVPNPCPGAEARATELGLYVEEFESPIRSGLE
jgi:hypothetical protein